MEDRTIALYPGPAGATESQLDLAAWSEIIAENAVLATLEPDVEAVLLLRREGATRCFIVPIDAAYRLVGIIRTSWKGFDGGADAWAKIDAYFARAARTKRRARTRAGTLVSELSFSIAGARVEPYAAAPQLVLRLRVAETSGVPVHAITLSAQVRIEPQQRRYDDPRESAALVELFGPPERYGDTLRTLLWTHVSATVLAFERETELDLTIPCSYDFDVAANKYLRGLEAGEIPLLVQFSGTVFVRGEDGGVAAELVPWSCEARYRLPVAVWRATMDAFFPNSAWIRVERDTFDELYAFKCAGGFPTWESALAGLLAEAKSTR